VDGFDVTVEQVLRRRVRRISVRRSSAHPAVEAESP
jgi:hypothetical protein